MGGWIEGWVDGGKDSRWREGCRELEGRRDSWKVG